MMFWIRLFIVSWLLALAAGAEGEAPSPGDEGLRLQIFLDQKCFGPGFLDGKPGNFTRRAAFSYNRSQGRLPGDWEAVMADARKEVENIYAVGIVPSFAKDYLNPRLPRKYEDVGGIKLMAYRSYLEFMAERYHTSEAFLIELNGRDKAYALKPGTPAIVPNIEPFRIENLAKGRMYQEEETLSQRTIVIDTRNKQLFIYDPSLPVPVVPGSAVVIADEEEEPLGQLVAMFPTTPGREKFIHRGTWEVKKCVEFPTWRYDKSLLETGRRGKKTVDVAPGPNNPVGIMWCGLSKSGIGIHGTSSPRTIGRSQSAGCYRLSNWDAARLPKFVRPGAKVIVR